MKLPSEDEGGALDALAAAMSPALSLCLVLFAQPAVEDAGAPAAAAIGPAAEVDAGMSVTPTPPVAAPIPTESPTPPPFVSFDVANTPWGPGRKSAGEVFRSAALALPEAPLRWSWNGFSLALGGQYLARSEVRDNFDFNTAVQDQTFGLEHRARLSMRASAKERVGVLLEFQDVRGWGTEPNTVTTTPNTGLHQGFVDVHAASWLDVRVGRQELSYGEDRLIGSLDWAMSARAFDGLFVRLTPSSAVTVDAFGMLLKPPAWLTDANGLRFHNSGSYFTGLYSRVRVAKWGLDVFALGLFEDPATAASGLSKDNNRVTLGARGFFAVSQLAVVGEGAFQTGKVGPREDFLAAGAFAAKATWTFSTVWGAPYVMAEFSMASPTFSQLFPTGHVHLGFADFVAWQNVVAERGTIGFRPWGAHVWLDVHHFNAWDPQAVWTTATGAVFLAADPMRTDGNMGTEVDLSVTVPVIANLAMSGNVSLFLPGGTAAARGQNLSTWAFLMVRAQL